MVVDARIVRPRTTTRRSPSIVGANVDPPATWFSARGPADHLDHATTRQFIGGKLGIDATAKGPDEGAREWPPEIEMSAAIRELVDRRWSEYGI